MQAKTVCQRSIDFDFKKFGSGPEKLPGLSRNRPQVRHLMVTHSRTYLSDFSRPPTGISLVHKEKKTVSAG